MSDYVPLDLTSLSNVENTTIRDRNVGPFGQQTLRGLPFQISPIYFDNNNNRAVEIPIRSKARWVIVAHMLFATRLMHGVPVGQTAAQYPFHFSDDQDRAPITVPIRERFEIAFVPPGWGLQYWGQSPFLAAPDRYDGLQPRDAGAWEFTGFRQTEVNGAWPERFFLWVWDNPSPDRELGCLRIEPLGAAFVVGGVTVSTLDENPLRFEPIRPVKISLASPNHENPPFNPRWVEFPAACCETVY
jgi:hypothetical protein